ncbi:MAG: ATP-dependent DNA helicase, partial [Candidatus Polarisedimenticolia bacterium]
MELRRDPALFFAAGGPLSRILPSFEPRPQQGHLAAAVLDTFASGGTLLAEAGTGVGKSLAYLLPALLWATRPGDLPPEERRVVVSTHTRALQEQLWRNDLPLLERALASCGVTFRSAILMGSENYLCVQRLEEARLQGGLPGEPGGKALADLARHAANAATGLRSAVPFAVTDALWSRVRRDREVCLGPRGPFWDSCLYRRDLKAARDAHLLVVNHALFFLDLAVGGRVLPPHGAVVLDEAHRVEETALSQLGLSVSDRSLAALAEEILPGASGGRRRGGGDRRDAAGIPVSRAVETAARRLGRESAAFFEA